MSSWANKNGLINIGTIKRPGKVLHYLLHKATIEGIIRDHLFAVVSWSDAHPSHMNCGKPLEIWKTIAVPEGPAIFIPIHLIRNRIVVNMRNAFNLVSREAVLHQCAIHFPELLPWVAWCYSLHQKLWHPMGQLISASGVQQGDPLGPLLFALVLHRTILKISADPQCKEMLQNCWYLDDGALAGPDL